MKATVFTRVKDGEKRDFVWQKTVYSDAVITSEETGIADGRECMQKTQMSVRLFGKDIPVPSVGDMVVSGAAESDSPPDDAGVIKSVSDNRRGSSRVSHIRLIVG